MLCANLDLVHEQLFAFWRFEFFLFVPRFWVPPADLAMGSDLRALSTEQFSGQHSLADNHFVVVRSQIFPYVEKCVFFLKKDDPRPSLSHESCDMVIFSANVTLRV